MGMDPITLGAIIMGGGQLISAGTDYINGRNANRQAAQRQALAGQFLQGGPSQYENLLAQLLGNVQGQGGPTSTFKVPGMETVTNNQAFNTGQDALMQLLRANPQTQVDSALDNILGGGMRFDTSELFGALQQQDKRRVNESVADMRAGASGLGQRFGTAMTNAEGNVRSQANEAAATRDAGIAQGSFEAAAARMMQAAGMMSQREQANMQNQSAVAQLLANLGMQQGQFGLQSGQLQLQQDQTNRQGQNDQMQQQMAILSQLLGAQGQRGQMNANLLSLMFGMPMGGQMPNMGGNFADMGQLLMFLPMLRNMGRGGA